MGIDEETTKGTILDTTTTEGCARKLNAEMNAEMTQTVESQPLERNSSAKELPPPPPATVAAVFSNMNCIENNKEETLPSRQSLGSIPDARSSSTPSPPTAQQAGAYSSMIGAGLQRREKIAFSSVGQQQQPPSLGDQIIQVEGNNCSAPSSYIEHQQEVGELVHHNNNTDGDLVEANPIEEPSSLGNAVEIDEAELEEERQGKQKRERMLHFAMVGLLMIVICSVGIALVLGLKFSLGREETASAGSVAQQSPTAAPSAAPSPSPSSSPTGSLDLMLIDLPDAALERIDQFGTAQWKALDWLLGHPELLAMPEWRKKQLFALVSFYFAMEGPNWRKDIKSNWLLYDVHECLWFSSFFGEFNAATGLWVAADDSNNHHNKTPCNQQQEFLYLDLGDLEVSEYNPYIPQELALLTTLSLLSLKDNNITSSFMEFLPSQLYQMTNMTHLNLNSNNLSGPLPSELGLLTSTTVLDLGFNGLGGSIPSWLGRITGMHHLELYSNQFTGRVPSQLGKMTDLAVLDLEKNMLSGVLPTELGLLTALELLDFESNGLDGSIPTQSGLLGDLQKLDLEQNSLTGTIPSQLGLLTRMTQLDLFDNNLTGPVPSEFGLFTELKRLTLAENRISGTLPSQLGLLTKLEVLRADNNILTGSIPTTMHALATDGTIFTLSLNNNNGLSGIVSGDLCSLGMLNATAAELEELPWLGFSFDCSAQLCGCCWCQCITTWGEGYNGELGVGGEVTVNNTGCPLARYVPSENDKEWPGSFPTPLNSPNVVTINIHSDDWPQETIWIWSKEIEPGKWDAIDSKTPSYGDTLFSYMKYVDSNSMYRLTITDEYADGTCCIWGFGWFTMTHPSPSKSHPNGTVIWSATGDEFEDKLDVYLWIDDGGNAQLVNETIG